jgi:hypothetical protein
MIFNFFKIYSVCIFHIVNVTIVFLFFLSKYNWISLPVEFFLFIYLIYLFKRQRYIRLKNLKIYATSSIINCNILF